MSDGKFHQREAIYWIGFMYCFNLVASQIPGLERYSPANEPYRSLIVGLIAWLGFTLYNKYFARDLSERHESERT
jgi:hypothetical protein